MTIISDRIESVAGGPLTLPVVFSVEVIRQRADGGAIVDTIRHRVQPVDGVITTPELDPGPALVEIPGHKQPYRITVPDTSATVRLWPLIDAYIAPVPDDPTGYVRDGGGLARGKALTQAEYDAHPFDPGTFYLITDSFIA